MSDYLFVNPQNYTASLIARLTADRNYDCEIFKLETSVRKGVIFDGQSARFAF